MRAAAAGLTFLLLAGCAAPLRVAPPAISPADLVAGLPLTGGVEPAALPAADILGLDAGMRGFMAGQVRSRGSDLARLHDLLHGLFDDESFVIEYDERTYTAAETFRVRRANCLAFTNLFVALGRAAGLDVHFQEVDVPADWAVSDGALVLNRHINTLVDLGEQGEQVVDFNMADFRASYDRRVISDDRARAHYYSNVGVERLNAGEPVRALQGFRRAIEADASFVPAWINLGILYQRAGQDAFAEAAWQQALVIDRREVVAMSNLERLYRRSGRLARADDLQGRIARHRLQNPYYRYQLAEAAFARADYDEAIAQLRTAISRKDNEDRFYALLGLAYLRRGDPASAQRFMARAGEVAGSDALKSAYHSKLEMLRRAQEPVTPPGS